MIHNTKPSSPACQPARSRKPSFVVTLGAIITVGLLATPSVESGAWNPTLDRARLSIGAVAVRSGSLEFHYVRLTPAGRQEGEGRLWFNQAGQFRLDRKRSNSKTWTKLVDDGQRLVLWSDGTPAGGGVAQSAVARKAFHQDMLVHLASLFLASPKGYNYRDSATTPIDITDSHGNEASLILRGNRVHAVMFQRRASAVTRLDRNSALSSSPGALQGLEANPSDFRQDGEWLIPHTLTLKHAGSDVEISTLDKVSLNSNIPESVFLSAQLQTRLGR